MFDRGVPGKRGTFYIRQSPATGAQSIYVRSIVSFDDEGINQSEIKFAVGGINMFLEMSTATDSRISDLMYAEDPSNYNHTSNKTAIIYLSENTSNGYNIVLCTLFPDNTNTPARGGSLPNVLEFRRIIKQYYPKAYGGVLLDGGGSTGMAYKLPSGNTRYTCITQPPRSIPTMITVS